MIYGAQRPSDSGLPLTVRTVTEMIRDSNRPFIHAVVLASALTLFAASPSEAQDYRFGSGDTAERIAEVGTSLVVQSVGPRLLRMGPIILQRFALYNRWVMVQDSTMGVVFTRPGGVKASVPDYVGDVSLTALSDVVAIEVRSLVFNVWNDLAGHLAVTRLVDQSIGESWSMDPRWTGVERSPTEHRTSVTWVHRVMFGNESIFEADLDVVREAVLALTGEELDDLGPPIQAVAGY